MSKSQRTIIEDRISEVRKSILLMQGELTGLEFALMLQDEVEQSKDNAKHSAKPKASKPVLIKPTVRSMARKVVYDNPDGFVFLDVWKHVCLMAKRQVSKKTVSSALSVLKEGGEVILEGKKYKPAIKNSAAQAA